MHDSGTETQQQCHPHISAVASLSKTENLALRLHPPRAHGTPAEYVIPVVTDTAQAKSAIPVTNDEDTYQPLIPPRPLDNNTEYQSLTKLTQPLDLPPPIPQKPHKVTEN